ncbi:hypothetical protein [Blautia massiliensis (ex Durand et al. 2017)]|nr:hypothetical protein [Blautia massiliensis (ex Durand et al. 2017)]
MMKSELKIRICDKVNTSILKNGVLFKAGSAGKGGECIQPGCMQGKRFL